MVRLREQDNKTTRQRSIYCLLNYCYNSSSFDFIMFICLLLRLFKLLYSVMFCVKMLKSLFSYPLFSSLSLPPPSSMYIFSSYEYEVIPMTSCDFLRLICLES